MPSSQSLPTINDLVKAARNALVGERDTYGDGRSGSIQNHFAGPVAILLAREVDRDQHIFEDTYFNGASGDALTSLVQGRWGTQRILSTGGVGVAQFQRASAAAGTGTLWAGTRIQLQGSPPVVVQVASNTVVTGTNVIVPIVAVVLGSGTPAIQAAAGLSLLDPIYDPLWLPVSLTCGEGTDYEAANDYRARSLSERLDDRNGYLLEMTTVCQEQGARYVIPFPSHFGLTTDDAGYANDVGLNAFYVADGNYQSPPALVAACALALENARVLGADLWVGGIIQTRLVIQVVVNLVDQPGNLNLLVIGRACAQALLGFFGPTAGGYSYKLDALAGAIVAAHPSVQQVSQWLSPTTDVVLSPNSWPAYLRRYTLALRDINLTFAGPL